MQPTQILRKYGFKRISRKEAHLVVWKQNIRECCVQLVDQKVLVCRRGRLFFTDYWWENLQSAFNERKMYPDSYFSRLWKWPSIQIGKMDKRDMERILKLAKDGKSFQNIVDEMVELIKSEMNLR